MPLTGSGTMTPATPGVSPSDAVCLEYLTVADLRAEFGDALAADSDAVLQRRLDRVVSQMETLLGHTFGRALLAQSTATENVEVSAEHLVIGGHTFSFALYPTLAELVAIVNAAGHGFSLTRLPQVRSDTPSTLLSVHTAAACGPTYDKRVTLCLDSLYCKLSGKASTHLFLPLNLASVDAVVENSTTLATTDYWCVPGENWLIRRACGCTGVCCCGLRSYWSRAYPGNIAVTYEPELWGQPPAALGSVLLEAYGARYDLGAMQSESFGEYKYTRRASPEQSWQQILGGSSVRQYAVQFQP